VKVLGLVGSPRKGGNTDLTVQAVLEGAAANLNSIEKIYLYDFEIVPCVDCKTCKKPPYQCVIKDDMPNLYLKLQEADAIIFGTPLYWYGPSAKMKLLIDRLRPLIASKSLYGKKAVLVIPSEEGAAACIHAVGMFALSFEYLGVDLAGKLMPHASEKGEVKNHPLTLKEALALGKGL
jgi:multimeric flavodoxin WrbA